MKKLGFWVLLLVGGTALLLGSYYVLTEVIFGPPAEVKAAMQSDASIQVDFLEGKSWMVMTPLDQPIKAGLLMYPENYQDIRMYAPILRQVAKAGYQVVILKRRGAYNLDVVKETARINKVMSAYPENHTWFIGAHSWEAGIVSAYLVNPSEKISGVVFWAGRVYADSDMSQVTLPVMNVYGTLDDANENLLAGNKAYLPPQTEIFWIEGGNRVNYANFGPLSRDVGATIPREEQQTQAANYTIDLMDGLLPE